MASLNVWRHTDENEENRSERYRRESPSVSVCQMSTRWTLSLGTAVMHALVVILEAHGILMNRT